MATKSVATFDRILPSLVHRYIVGTQGRFTNLADAITWLGVLGNMTGPAELLVDAGDYAISDTLTVNLPYHLDIRGFDFLSCNLQADTGLTNKPMIEVVTSCFIKEISFDGSTLGSYGTQATEVAILQSGGVYMEVIESFAKGFYDGIHLTGSGSSLFFFNNIVEDITNIAVNADTVGAVNIDVEINTFTNCQASVGFTQSSSGVGTVKGNVFANGSAGQICIVYDPANFTYIDHPSITNNDWNLVGTFSTGADYTRSDGRDANIQVYGNIGRENKNPHAKINVLNNASGTTVTTAGIYYKAAFTNALDSYTCKMALANGKMTYQSDASLDGKMFVSGTVAINATGHTGTICIKRHLFTDTVTGDGALVTVTTTGNHKLKNNQQVQLTGWTGGTGTWNGIYTITVVDPTTFTYVSTGNGTATGGSAGVLYGQMPVRCQTSGANYPFSLNAYISDMQKDDYYELFVTASSNADVVTVSNLNRFFESM